MALNLTHPIFRDEDKARAYFEAIRWPNGPVCPHCGATDRLNRLPVQRTKPSKKNPEGLPVYGLWKCSHCKGQFTVRTRTVMESSHAPLTKWALAYRLIASAKKGMSAHQLARTVGVTYKTAWFMAMRIREAMRDVSGDKLGGSGKIVEADEVYVGGKPRKGTDGQKTKMDRKTPVAVLVERDGRAKATILSHPMDGDIKRNVVSSVARETEIHSDEHKAYRNVGKLVGGFQFAVNHGEGVFAKEDIHVNTAESWNALLKRSIYGSFHHISREHLSRYCDEIVFRWDRRSIDDTARTAQAIKGGDGKRLTYRRTRGWAPPSALT